jgi:hypothetical protein
MFKAPISLMTIPLSPKVSGALFGCLLLVSGCGGGGGGSSPAPTPPPPPAANLSPTCTIVGASFSVVADVSVPVGRTAGAVVAGCTGPLRDVSWQQTGGPSVGLLSAKTQAITFDAVATGTYTFTVSFVDAGDVASTATATINVTAAASPVLVIARGDQAVRMGGKASVRAWPAASGGETLSWTQIAGPTVTLDTNDPNRIIFTAPTVVRDTALAFRVTRTSASGSDSDDVMVLVENYTQAPSDPSNTGPYIFSDMHVSRVYAYKPSGPYAGVLVTCVNNAQLQYTAATTNICPLATLPLLHTITGGNVPTVAQIMDRVLVSHDWMGKAFEELLTANQSNVDLMRLFNGVTAVVIGAHVRPSFYYAMTGAIYLDADNFWRTADERDVIDEAPDFRSDFDRDLQYSGLWRYVEGNESIFFPFTATSRTSRDLTFVLKEAGWLMYHELGHASDFLPVTVRDGLNTTLSVWPNIAPRYPSQLPSGLLSSNFPLSSGQMSALAQIKFATGPVSDTTLVNGIPYSTLKTYTPNDVAGFFAADIATDEYNYSTIREDIAMTFEEVLMARNHGWRRDVAITDKVTTTSTGNSVVVHWGQRGRVGDANIKPRAQFVVSQLAPWVDPADVAALAAPIPMRAGDTWNGNLVLPAPPSALASAQAYTGPRLSTEEDRLLLRRALSRQLIGVAGPAGSHGSPNERWLKRIQH